jgi:release factor glutamine methyltransferase
MLRADAPTLAEWLHHAAHRMDQEGVGNGRRNAEALAAHALGIRWSDLWTRLRDPVPDAPALERLVDRRAAGEPLAYIVGTTEFFGLELRCGPGVLVPRPETETLVSIGLELVCELERPTIVDVGTGSGAVAIALAAQRPDAIVWATDISEGALGYARSNAERNGVNVTFVHGDLLDGTPPDTDLVVGNPPYISDGTWLPPDVAAEPPVALFGGPLGDDLLVRLVMESTARNMAVEIGTADQAKRIHSLLRTLVTRGGTTGVTNDLDGRPRVVWAKT